MSTEPKKQKLHSLRWSTPVPVSRHLVDSIVRDVNRGPTQEQAQREAEERRIENQRRAAAASASRGGNRRNGEGEYAGGPDVTAMLAMASTMPEALA